MLWWRVWMRVRVTSGSHGRLGRKEFISLLALSTALSALGIDIMLPAMGAIRAELGLAPTATEVAGLVTTYIAGLGAGQILYGPVSDRFGRRRVLYAGYIVYALGALISTLAVSLPLLLVARLVWGVGAAGPRVIAIAIIRDTHEGDQMSRAMSFVMAVFLLVPILAPLLGAVIVSLGTWRMVFGVCVLIAGIMMLWAIRLPETLRDEHRLELQFSRVATAMRFVVADRAAVGHTLAITALYGAFFAYLASSEVIIAQTYGRPGLFPFVFGGLAAVMGTTMITNGRIVGRFGTQRLTHLALVWYSGLGIVLVGVAIATGGRPSLAVFIAGMAGLLVGHAVLIPNLNALAMANMAPVAGTASALIGGTQMLAGAGLGALVDQAYQGTVLPLWVGFAAYGLLSLATVTWTERGRLFRPPEPGPATG